MAKSFHEQLGLFLREKRGDLTYKQFGRKLGISYVTIHRLERGVQNVTLKTLEQICKRLKCGMGDIFGKE